MRHLRPSGTPARGVVFEPFYKYGPDASSPAPSRVSEARPPSWDFAPRRNAPSRRRARSSSKPEQPTGRSSRARDGDDAACAASRCAGRPDETTRHPHDGGCTSRWTRCRHGERTVPINADKTYSVTGWRVGDIVLPATDAIRKVHDSSPWGGGAARRRGLAPIFPALLRRLAEGYRGGATAWYRSRARGIRVTGRPALLCDGGDRRLAGTTSGLREGSWVERVAVCRASPLSGAEDGGGRCVSRQAEGETIEEAERRLSLLVPRA